MITEKYCLVRIVMYNGKVSHCNIYTTVTINGIEKTYLKDVTEAEAGRAMYKLAKATGRKPRIEYNSLDHTITEKVISYIWEA